MWRERGDGARGWVAESVVSGKAGIFSSTARLPCLLPLPFSPACCRGPLQASWEHHNLPFRSLPSPKDFSHPFWFIFCSDVCLPYAHPHRPPKENNRKNRCELGCGVAQLGLLPQRYVLGCMPGVVEEPSPAAESRLKLTSGFFAATLATFAGGGCSVDWE